MDTKVRAHQSNVRSQELLLALPYVQQWPTHLYHLLLIFPDMRKELNWKWTSQEATWHLYGSQCHRQQLCLLCNNADLCYLQITSTHARKKDSVNLSVDLISISNIEKNIVEIGSKIANGSHIGNEGRKEIRTMLIFFFGLNIWMH